MVYPFALPDPEWDWSIEKDLDSILEALGDVLPELQSARILVTGGTGFIGRWLLETINRANASMDVNIHVTILTRNAHNYGLKAPHLASAVNFELLEGDVTDFSFPTEAYSHIIHGATDASAWLNENDPKKMFDVVVEGTRRVLEFAANQNDCIVLLMSSGAIYGQQPWEEEQVSEDYRGSPDCINPTNTYAEAKRAAEMLCAIYCKQYGVRFVSARIFALLGPFLPFDIHFAAGNFIRDALEGKDIIVRGDGRPVRSYLYTTDLVIWLITILVLGGDSTAVNVGSDEAVSIGALAKKVATLVGDGRHEILSGEDAGWNLGRYVPDVTMAAAQLGLKRTVDLDEAILRTAAWSQSVKEGI
jgi:nucleoside-diphosphate-sugar epimerase